VEYIDHLHDHFLDPVTMREGKYVPPEKPGYSAQMHPGTLEKFRYPDGAEWSTVN
jgi:L-fuconate dehydratase